MAATAQAHISCLCGAVSEPGSLLSTAALPTDTDLCHCNPCRYTSGGLFTTIGELRCAPSTRSLSKCTAYASSKILTRYFCSTCGSYCFLHTHAANRWTVFSGLIEPAELNAHTNDVVRTTHQGFAGDTLDYALPSRLLRLGDQVPCYEQDSDEPALTGDDMRAKSLGGSAKIQPRLHAQCHCGSISFSITRPHWADLPEGTPYVPALGHRDKCMASFCCCQSCRKAFGIASVVPWAYVPPENVCDSLGQRVNFHDSDAPALVGLRDYYTTEAQVKYSFCAKCGATVFYWRQDRPHIVNVAPGLFRADEGSMASQFLWWRWHRFAWMKEVLDEKLMEALLDRPKEQSIEVRTTV